MRRPVVFSFSLLLMALLPLAASGQPASSRIATDLALQQQDRVAAQTAYLLELSAQQRGGSLPPQEQAELTRRANEYFSNGAQATAVPTAGPAASYFSNGAAVSTVPTSVIPDFAFGTEALSPPTATVTAPEASAPQGADAGVSATPAPEAGEAAAATSVASGPATVEPPAGSTPPGPSEAPAATEPPPVEPAAGSAAAPGASAVPSATAAAMVGPLAASPPHAATTSTRSILSVMLAGVAIAALLVLLGVSVHPRPRGPRPRST
jgi:hypothetical protein